MASRRPERIASVIQEEVSRRLLTEVKDPRIGPVSITGVTVNHDLTVAHIRYLPLGGRGDRVAIQAGLESASRNLRGSVGRALGIRHAPELRFEIDKNIEYAAHMEDVFRQLPPAAPEEPEAAEAPAEPAESVEDGGSRE